MFAYKIISRNFRVYLKGDLRIINGLGTEEHKVFLAPFEKGLFLQNQNSRLFISIDLHLSLITV